MIKISNLLKSINEIFPDKRQRFAIQTTILTASLIITQLIWEDYRFFLVIISLIISYFLTAWSLTEDIKGIEWLLLFILPIFFTGSVFLFYFLLPSRWIARLMIALIFAVGSYAVLLVENIYNVAAIRSIQLLRAAQSIGFLLTLIVFYLSSNIIFSLRRPFYQNMIFFIPITFLLSLQSLWSVNLEETISKKLFLYAGVISLSIGELALVLSFWPLGNAQYSLLITASVYALIGLVQHYFFDRLFKNTIREYILVFLFTLTISFLTTKWG